MSFPLTEGKPAHEPDQPASLCFQCSNAHAQYSTLITSATQMQQFGPPLALDFDADADC